MNHFTKEELQIILLDMNSYIYRTTLLAESPSHKALRDKIESMIDNYCEQEPEDEIFSCYTGLALSDEFFFNKQHMGSDDLLPAIHELVNQCHGMIRERGIYAIKLRLVKMK